MDTSDDFVLAMPPNTAVHDQNDLARSNGAARPQSSFQGCSRITEYEVLGKLGEGTFGEVHRAKSKRTGAVVALKKILMHNEKDGFPITALREIKLLKILSHTNILRLEEMAIEHSKSSDKRKRATIYMVTPYMDHDLSGLLENPAVTFTEPQIKCYMLQLLEGLRYLHGEKILHRDMKAANLLINNKGILQIADFGLARHYDGPVPITGQGGGDARREYTTLVVTRWYRPPELLLSLRKYTTAIDLWGVGCVFGEMLIGKPILAGETDPHQLLIICELVGTPNEQSMPGWRRLPGAQGLNLPIRTPTLSQRFREYGSGAISLLNDLLKLDWRKRSNAIDALQHPYFTSAPLPARPGDIPMFEESHELDRRKFRSQKAAPPPAPKGGTVGQGPNAGWNGEQNGGDRRDTYDNYNRSHKNGGRYPPHQRDHRNGLPPPPPLPDDRRPAWRRDDRGDRDRGDRPDTRLPPRPQVPLPDMPLPYDGGRSDRGSYRSQSRDIDRAPPRRTAPNVDTYIPSYGPESGRPSRGDRSRDDRYDDRPRRRDERDDRRHERDHGRDRLDYGDDRSRGTRTRSRSQSPRRGRDRDVRQREPLDRDMGDRDQVYRR
ncbi:Serine/threonine-protein kinase bur-1 [Calycina marina]|uniref:Serine/threonine-protein kinase BUR1 n=1 Tax=Calycina marina TaxID=1763456 RepID=A0A9P7Z9P4_9HELO|nr:Serine/threonine-protein kinase bur-1 [Calycina marina]